jgi:hypothetical protein
MLNTVSPGLSVFRENCKAKIKIALPHEREGYLLPAFLVL